MIGRRQSPGIGRSKRG